MRLKGFSVLFPLISARSSNFLNCWNSYFTSRQKLKEKWRKIGGGGHFENHFENKLPLWCATKIRSNYIRFSHFSGANSFELSTVYIRSTQWAMKIVGPSPDRLYSGLSKGILFFCAYLLINAFILQMVGCISSV